MNYPDILHHGAKDGVTGSCHQLLMDAEHSLLIDCGLFQGAETSPDGKSGADRLAIEFSLDTIKALVATHVHIDHVGRIPYLLAAGFKGPILCSEPSAKLLPIVLEDAFKLGFSHDQKQVERLGLNNVHFLGGLPDEDKAVFLSLCYAVVSPRSPGFGYLWGIPARRRYVRQADDFVRDRYGYYLYQYCG